MAGKEKETYSDQVSIQGTHSVDQYVSVTPLSPEQYAKLIIASAQNAARISQNRQMIADNQWKQLLRRNRRKPMLLLTGPVIPSR